MKYLLSLLLIFSPIVYAGDYHNEPKPPPVVVNNDNDNGTNMVPVLAIIAIGICWYNRCLTPDKVTDKEPNKITPDNLSDRPKVRLQ